MREGVYIATEGYMYIGVIYARREKWNLKNEGRRKEEKKMVGYQFCYTYRSIELSSEKKRLDPFINKKPTMYLVKLIL